MKKIIYRTKRLFSKCGSSNLQIPSEVVDVREEYANAFRTESYNEFWTRVLTLTRPDSTSKVLAGSTSTTRLHSYRIFVENLLDPDQPTVTKMLTLTGENKPLISDYFEATARASTLCGVLLKDIDQIRIKYRTLRKTLSGIGPISSGSENSMSEFTNSINPFVSSSASLTHFGQVKSNCAELLKRLESSRNKAQAKLRLCKSLKHGMAVSLIAMTTSITVIIVTHFLAIAVAMPVFVAAGSLSSRSMKQLARTAAQLDTAAKGTYILNRDLETIRRLVARLDDELEHIRAVIGFWMGRAEAQAGEEVARQLIKKDESCFVNKLDELEEHLYLCFMTINRARKLVVKEILDLHPI